MTNSLIIKLGYPGIILLLVLGGLGLPVPEEAPIILAAVLSKKGAMLWPIALAACFAGVLIGDFVVYFLGYYYGERVLSLPLTRKFLTRAREAQIKGYFHRHGIKILILGRFAVGFRTAAYLTAGILRLPPVKLFLADLCAATFSTLLMFGLGYFFAHWVENRLNDAKQWIPIVIGICLASWLLHRYIKARQRAGQPIGPPVPVTDEVPLPPDDLHPAAPTPPQPPTEVTAAASTEVVVTPSVPEPITAPTACPPEAPASVEVPPSEPEPAAAAQQPATTEEPEVAPARDLGREAVVQTGRASGQ